MIMKFAKYIIILVLLFNSVVISFSQDAGIVNSFIEITGSKGERIFKTNSIIEMPVGSEINISNAEIVFTGFGFKDENSGYDDFGGVDLRGKVALFALGTPDLYS